MADKIKIEFSRDELTELIAVIAAGYADGDFEEFLTPQTSKVLKNVIRKLDEARAKIGA